MFTTASIELKGDIDFSFQTTYMGHDIELSVLSKGNSFAVFHSGHLLGYIKLGGVAHTWCGVDKNFISSYLIDEIGNRIEAQYLVLN